MPGPPCAYVALESRAQFEDVVFEKRFYEFDTFLNRFDHALSFDAHEHHGAATAADHNARTTVRYFI